MTILTKKKAKCCRESLCEYHNPLPRCAPSTAKLNVINMVMPNTFRYSIINRTHDR